MVYVVQQNSYLQVPSADSLIINILFVKSRLILVSKAIFKADYSADCVDFSVSKCYIHTI